MEIGYRGHNDVLWKQNFPLLFTKHPGVSLINKQQFHYKNTNLSDIAYLLKKL